MSPHAICQAATLYRRGILCPAELWVQVARHLIAAEAASLLGALPAEVQAILRGAYAERPPIAAFGGQG